jgi:hypothetical protein
MATQNTAGIYRITYPDGTVRIIDDAGRHVLMAITLQRLCREGKIKSWAVIG